MSSTALKFTLRFRNRQTHEILGLLAERRGVSKNQLAEEMIEREVQAAALLLADDLTGDASSCCAAIGAKRISSRPSRTSRMRRRIEEDPIKTSLVRSSADDAFGISQAFVA